MKPLFDIKKKYTLIEVTEILGNALFEILSAQLLIVGKKIIVKGYSALNAEIFFNNSESSTYKYIVIKIINTKNQTSENYLTIDMSDKKYGSNPNLSGGYFWTAYSEWYSYVPDFDLILKDIKDSLEFLEVI